MESLQNMALLRKPSAGAPAAKTTLNKTSSIFSKAKQINARNKEQGESRRERLFDLTVPPGDHRDVLILDVEPYAQYEHQYEVNGKWSGFAVCIRETDACPACSTLGREGSFTIRMTCLDTTPFTIKNGDNAGKEVRISRKMLAIKTSVAPKFERLLERHGNGARGFRGMYLRLNRDSAKEARCGSDIEFLKLLSDDEIARFIAKYESDPKRRIELAQVCDYKKAYPVPTAAQLREQFGVNNTIPGTEEFEETDDVIDDEIPF